MQRLLEVELLVTLLRVTHIQHLSDCLRDSHLLSGVAQVDWRELEGRLVLHVRQNLVVRRILHDSPASNCRAQSFSCPFAHRLDAQVSSGVKFFSVPSLPVGN